MHTAENQNILIFLLQNRAAYGRLYTVAGSFTIFATWDRKGNEMLHINIERDGKIELDLETTCIIAALDAGGKGTQNFVCFDHATNIEVAACIASVLWKINHLDDKYQDVRRMAEFAIQSRELGGKGVKDD